MMSGSMYVFEIEISYPTNAAAAASRVAASPAISTVCCPTCDDNRRQHKYALYEHTHCCVGAGDVLYRSAA